MRIAIFLFIIQSILWLAHLLVYKTAVRFFGLTGTGTLGWVRVTFIILSIIFLVVSVASMRYYGPVTRGVYAFAAVWMGTLYWLFWASVLMWVVYGVFRLLNIQAFITPVAALLFVLAACISAYGLWNSYQTQVREVTVVLPNLPEHWRGKKIVLVADTHLGNMRNGSFSKKIAGLIAEQKPEAVLIAGDFYDGVAADYQALAKPFGDIPSRYGTLFAPGNHEEFRPKNVYFDGLEAGGVQVLDSKVVDLDGLQVIGVGYFDTINPENQKSILQKLAIQKNMPSILLKHVPNHLKAAESEGINLQLSGHTHTGQVFPGRWITSKIYAGYEYGLKSFGAMQVYTTSGAGTWGPPQRVGTYPEIVVIILDTN